MRLAAREKFKVNVLGNLRREVNDANLPRNEKLYVSIGTR